MRSPQRLFVLVALLLASAGPAFAQAPLAEEFFFPQTHDTKFGSSFFADPFDWWQDGDGAKGRRISSQGIATVTAVGYSFALGPSCIFNTTPVFLDFYVNDQLMGSSQLPSNVLCNNTPGVPPDANPPGSHLITATYTPGTPLHGLGAGNEYEFRFQLRGTVGPIVGTSLLAFYHVDTSHSTVAIAGEPGGDGGGDPPPPPPPPPPDTSHDQIVSQVQQSESNIISNQTTALDAVKNKLGIVDDKLQTVANNVLNLDASAGAGLANLSNQLGVRADQLAAAIQGNSSALEDVKASIAKQIIPQLEVQGATLESVRDNFMNNALGQALSIGGRLLSFMTPVGILGVSDFVGNAINQVINGNLRPDRIIRRATAEFNRGLRRLRRIFRVSAHPTTAEEQQLAARLADLPGGDDALAGPDTESEDIFGAYVWFERAYQTLVKGEANNRPLR